MSPSSPSRTPAMLSTPQPSPPAFSPSETQYANRSHEEDSRADGEQELQARIVSRTRRSHVSRFLDISAKEDNESPEDEDADVAFEMADFLNDEMLYEEKEDPAEGDLDDEVDDLLSPEEQNQRDFEQLAQVAASFARRADQKRLVLPDDEDLHMGEWADLSRISRVQTPPIARIQVPCGSEQDLVLWLIRHSELMPDIIAAYANPLVPGFVYVETTNMNHLLSAFKGSPLALVIPPSLSSKGTTSNPALTHGITSYSRYRSISRNAPVLLDTFWDVKASLSIRAQHSGWARVTGEGKEAFRYYRNAALYRGDLVFVCDASTVLAIPRIDRKDDRPHFDQRPTPAPFVGRDLQRGERWEQKGQYVHWNDHWFRGPFEEIQCKVVHHPWPVTFLSDPPTWNELRPFVELDSLSYDDLPVRAGKASRLVVDLDSPCLAQAYAHAACQALQAGDRAVFDTDEPLEYGRDQRASDVFIREIDYAHGVAVVATNGFTDTGLDTLHKPIPSFKCRLADLKLHPLSPPRIISEGDRVVVVRPTAQAEEGLVGRVCAIDGVNIRILTVHEDPPKSKEVSIGDVCVHFVSADVVRIADGQYAGMKGVVLNTEADGRLSLQLTTAEAICDCIQGLDHSKAQSLEHLESLLLPVIVPKWQVRLVTLGAFLGQGCAVSSQAASIEMLLHEEKMKLQAKFMKDAFDLKRFEVLIVAGPHKGKRGRIVDYRHTVLGPSNLDFLPDVGTAAHSAAVIQRDPLDDVELTVGLDGTMKNEAIQIDHVRELQSGFRLRQAVHFRNLSTLPLFHRPRTPSPPPEDSFPQEDSKFQPYLSSQEDGSWLCETRLWGKRVDVVIDDPSSLRRLQLKKEKELDDREKGLKQDEGTASSKKSKAHRTRVLDALSAQLYERGAGKPAFVVAKKLPDAQTGTIDAHIWPFMQVMKVPTSALKPCRQTLPAVGGGDPRSILDTNARVVIIGPTVDGSILFLGQYGETISSTRVGLAIDVRFEWRMDVATSEAHQPVARFDWLSLCSSTNVTRNKRGTNNPLYMTSRFDL